MKLRIENTDKVIQMQPQGGAGAIKARIWEGETENGTKVHLYVARVAVPEGADQSAFQRELEEAGAPRKASPDVEAIPLRLII